MPDDEIKGPDRGQRPTKDPQQLFDDEVAKAGHTAFVVFGGLGVFAALLMSTIALVNSGNTSTTTVTVPSAAAGHRGASGAGGAGGATQVTGNALGAQLFTSGNPSTGAIGCSSCHTMKAAGATGTIGPNLDKVLTADPPSPTRESIVDPNKEIVPGYSANVMPTNYGTALSKAQLSALVTYVYESTNTKAKSRKGSGSSK